MVDSDDPEVKQLMERLSGALSQESIGTPATANANIDAFREPTPDRSCVICGQSRDGRWCKPSVYDFWWHGQGLINKMVGTDIGDMFIRSRLADFPATVSQRAWNFFFNWHCRRRAFGLVIAGPVGRGKTHLAAGLMRCWLLNDARVHYVHARRLFRAVRDTYRTDSPDSETEVIGTLCRWDLLVIDDLAREGRTTEQVVSVLHEILDERLRNFRATVITTNLSAEEMEQEYGEAIASRLAQYEYITLDGPDRRQA